mgnify:CR=1 FL=1
MKISIRLSRICALFDEFHFLRRQVIARLKRGSRKAGGQNHEQSCGKG